MFRAGALLGESSHLSQIRTVLRDEVSVQGLDGCCGRVFQTVEGADELAHGEQHLTDTRQLTRAAPHASECLITCNNNTDMLPGSHQLCGMDRTVMSVLIMLYWGFTGFQTFDLPALRNLLLERAARAFTH